MCLNWMVRFHFPPLIYDECWLNSIPVNYQTLQLRTSFATSRRDLLISCAFSNIDISGSQYGHDVNCSNEDVSLSCKLWLFRYVRNSLVIVSFITLIVIHNRSSVYNSNDLQRSKRTVSTQVRFGPVPPSRVVFVQRMKIDPCPTLSSSRSRSDVVQL